MNAPKLYLLLGLPGSGKTTAAEVISKLTGAVHLSSDSFRLSLFESPNFTQEEHDSLYKMLDYMSELLLKNGSSVVYDANLNRYQHRLEKYKLARRAGAKTELVWLVVAQDTARQRRMETQRHELIPAGETGPAMFDRIAGIFEPPIASESFTELDGTKINEKYVRGKLGL